MFKELSEKSLNLIETRVRVRSYCKKCIAYTNNVFRVCTLRELSVTCKCRSVKPYQTECVNVYV